MVIFNESQSLFICSKAKKKIGAFLKIEAVEKSTKLAKIAKVIKLGKGCKESFILLTFSDAEK